MVDMQVTIKTHTKRHIIFQPLILNILDFLIIPIKAISYKLLNSSSVVIKISNQYNMSGKNIKMPIKTQALFYNFNFPDHIVSNIKYAGIHYVYRFLSAITYIFK